MRLFARSIYSGDISIPTNDRPNFLAAIAVVPLPINGSSIKFAFVLLIILSINATGNGAGCSFFISWVNSQMSP